MKLMGYFRGFRALVILALIIPLAALIVFPWTFITGRVGLLYCTDINFARLGVCLAGVRVKVIGRDNLDRAGIDIFMSNHHSDLARPHLLPDIPGRTSA